MGYLFAKAKDRISMLTENSEGYRADCGYVYDFPLLWNFSAFDIDSFTKVAAVVALISVAAFVYGNVYYQLI